MKKDNKIYFWACDYCDISGEGILAKLFIKEHLKKKPTSVFVNVAKNNKFQKRDNFIKNRSRFNGIYHKYFFPYLGLLNLWIYFFNSKKISYINYLPLWNCLIFFLLPPKTIIGPITGTIQRKKFYWLISLLEKISLIIIKIRFEEIIFSNNFFVKKYSFKNQKVISNFILKNFKFSKKNPKKKFDFVIYHRSISTLHTKYIYEMMNILKAYKYSFAVIGDRINLPGNKNFGYISRKKTQKVISESKFAISNPENLFSFFVQDCLSYKLKIFYNIFFKKFNSIKTKNLIPISFESVKKDLKIILKIIKNKKYT